MFDHVVMRASKLCLVLGVLSVSLLTGIGLALAHRPFTTQVEKVALPDGQLGEVRLLHGDGIVAADPIRVLVVNASGRLLARSYRTPMMALTCSREKHCRAFDVGRARVLDIDPATFREGPIVPYYGDELWAIESGEESWGFRVRPASLRERLEGQLALAKREMSALVLLFVVGILVGVMVLRRPPEIELADGMLLLKILAVGLVLLPLAALVFLLSAITEVLFLGSAGAGIVTSMLLRRAEKHLRERLQWP